MTEPRKLGEEPSRVAPADLGSAFAKGAPDRAAGVRSLLGPPRAPAPDRPQAEAPQPASQSGKPQPRPPRQPTRKPRPRSQKTAQGRQTTPNTVAVVVYMPPELRDRLRAHTTRRGAAYSDVVLDALDATADQLAQLVTAPAVDRPVGSLFRGRQLRRQQHDTPQVQVGLRLAPDDLATVDQLKDQAGAISRSQLVTAALDAYLAEH